MGQQIAYRLLLSVPVLLGVLVFGFLLLKLAPGDPAMVVAGPSATPDVVEQIRKEMGLDQPTLVVTDLRMPAGGGVSVLERLALSSKTFHDPHPRRDGQCRRGAGTPGIEAGALRVLKKPINPTSLLEAVREAIGGPF